MQASDVVSQNLVLIIFNHTIILFSFPCHAIMNILPSSNRSITPWLYWAFMCWGTNSGIDVIASCMYLWNIQNIKPSFYIILTYIFLLQNIERLQMHTSSLVRFMSEWTAWLIYLYTRSIAAHKIGLHRVVRSGYHKGIWR